MFGSDVEDYVGADEDDGDFDDFQPSTRGLCKCPCTNSDTCLFDRSGSGLHSPKRPKSSEGSAVAGVATAVTSTPTEIEQMRQFFPPEQGNQDSQPENAGDVERRQQDEPRDIVPLSKEAMGLEGNLSERIMRCLNYG